MSAVPLVLASLVAASCGGALTRQQQLNQSLESEIQALRTLNAQLEQQVHTCADAPPPALYNDLRTLFADRGVAVERQGQSVVLTLPGGVVFADSGMRLREESGWALDLLSAALLQHPGWAVLIEVHTDDRPPTGQLARSYPTNWELSAARAALLTRELTDRYGLPAERLTAAGRGSVAPLTDNSTPEGRDMNRRVRVVLTPMEPL